MERMGVDHVDRVLLAGAFGSYIDARHAMVLGMIPDCEPVESHDRGQLRGRRRADRAAQQGRTRGSTAAGALDTISAIALEGRASRMRSSKPCPCPISWTASRIWRTSSAPRPHAAAARGVSDVVKARSRRRPVPASEQGEQR